MKKKSPLPIQKEEHLDGHKQRWKTSLNVYTVIWLACITKAKTLMGTECSSMLH